MELSNLIHKLTIANVVTVIDEPQGFDNLTVSFERGEYHGISAESSLGNLGFYGTAATLIKNAYEEDIDTEVIYSAETPAGDIVYSAVVDLSTLQEKSGQYRLVSCKVGEVGVKTTFNNRVGMDVDLNALKTIDGKDIAHPPYFEQSINIPQKHIVYTNKERAPMDRTYTQYDDGSTLSSILGYLTFGFTETVNEYGTYTPNNFMHVADDWEYISPQYQPDAEHEDKYGSNTKVSAEMSVTMVFYPHNVTTTGNQYLSRYYEFQPRIGSTRMLDAGNTIVINGTEFEEASLSGSGIERTFTFRGLTGVDIPADGIIKFALHVQNRDMGSIEFTKIVIKADSYVKLTMVDNLPSVSCFIRKPYFIHEAMNTIVEAISENGLTVKSDYYQHASSPVNGPEDGIPGAGALKFLTNGYAIRNIGGHGMPLSFKDAIDSLNALDCIGWGFSKENGVEYLRIEPFEWFYQNDILCTITDIKEVTRSVDADKILTSLVIGYKKYATSEEYNSIDSIHSERTFLSTIKAVSGEKEVLCDFIADNYAIEETRRARFNTEPTAEFKYDENIFIFEVIALRSSQASHDEDGTFMISNTAVVSSITNMNRPTELINAKLSPRRCADRWKGMLFTTNSQSDMNFGTGTVNYQTAFQDIPAVIDEGGGSYAYSLEQAAEGESLAENDGIANTHAIYQAETIEFEYPLSREQYAAIKANPYGLIVVNGEPCWIKKLEYTVVSGLTKFTLIPKYEEE